MACAFPCSFQKAVTPVGSSDSRAALQTLASASRTLLPFVRRPSILPTIHSLSPSHVCPSMLVRKQTCFAAMNPPISTTIFNLGSTNRLPLKPKTVVILLCARDVVRSFCRFKPFSSQDFCLLLANLTFAPNGSWAIKLSFLSTLAALCQNLLHSLLA